MSGSKVLLVSNTATPQGVYDFAVTLGLNREYVDFAQIQVPMLDSVEGDFDRIVLDGYGTDIPVGNKIVRLIKSRWPKAPLLVMTQHREPKMLQHIYDVGADGILDRYVMPAECLRVLRALTLKPPIDNAPQK